MPTMLVEIAASRCPPSSRVAPLSTLGASARSTPESGKACETSSVCRDLSTGWPQGFHSRGCPAVEEGKREGGARATAPVLQRRGRLGLEPEDPDGGSGGGPDPLQTRKGAGQGRGE